MRCSTISEVSDRLRNRNKRRLPQTTHKQQKAFAVFAVSKISIACSSGIQHIPPSVKQRLCGEKDDTFLFTSGQQVVFALVVVSLLYQVWNKLLTTCNKLDGIIRLVTRLF